MFNGAILDLAEKPYIQQKFYFNEFAANVLRDVIGIVVFDLLLCTLDQTYRGAAKKPAKQDS